MRETGRGLTLLAAAALSVACADRSPTGPAMAAVEGVSAQAASASSNGRSVPRSLAPRLSTAAGLIGTWGGDHVRITVGTASSLLEYDCAHGSIDQPFVVNASGRFDLIGTHVIESGGPIRDNMEVVRHPARYAGSTNGKTLTYTVTLTDSNRTFGPFALARDAPGSVFKCL